MPVQRPNVRTRGHGEVEQHLLADPDLVGLELAVPLGLVERRDHAVHEGVVGDHLLARVLGLVAQVAEGDVGGRGQGELPHHGVEAEEGGAEDEGGDGGVGRLRALGVLPAGEEEQPGEAVLLA